MCECEDLLCEIEEKWMAQIQALQIVLQLVLELLVLVLSPVWARKMENGLDKQHLHKQMVLVKLVSYGIKPVAVSILVLAKKLLDNLRRTNEPQHCPALVHKLV